MPSRLLREGILDSEGVSALTFPAEVFYRRLMSIVDDFGRYDARPSVLRGRLYPLLIDKVREVDIKRWMSECVEAKLITLYTVEGKPFLLFHKLGSPRAKESKYPEPPIGTDLENTSVNRCAQMQTDESIREQMKASVPYSGSGTSSGIHPPNPPPSGGGAEPSRSKTKPKTDEHPRFAEFWSAYPRKTARKHASAAFSKIDPDETTFAAMLAALARQRKSESWQRESGRFIPHPATWLNGSRWLDEETPPPAPPTSRPATAAYD